MTCSRGEMLLAEAAHALWCERMLAHGWRRGVAYNASAGAHDAIVPFEELATADRDALDLTLRAEQEAERLVALVDYPRGPDRPMTVKDMRVGRELALVDEPDMERRRVTIDSWQVDEGTGVLTKVVVRDRSGATSAHVPWEGTLRRVEPE